MTLQEKIATVPKLERIDSSIDSCIKILEQELNKRKVETPELVNFIDETIEYLHTIDIHFQIMRGKK